MVDPDSLLAVTTGLAQLNVEHVHAPAVVADEIFAALEQSRDAGTLSAAVTNAPIRYQASTQHAGLLERIDADGQITVGRFRNGQFTAVEVKH